MFLKLRSSRYMQYVSATAATISISSSSTYLTWPSPSLPKLQSEDSPIGRPISEDEGSWVVSSQLLSAMPAAFLGGWLIEKFGRKKTLLFGGTLLFIPWIMIIFGKHIAWLYTARVIAGFGNIIVTIGCAIYNGEIAENDIRGKLGTSFVILKLVGSLIVLSVGPYISYNWLAIICSVIPVIFIFLFVFMPESPYYLVKINKRNKAGRNLRILSSNAVDDKFIDNRLDEMEKTVIEDMQNKTTLWEFLSNKEYRKAFLIMTGIKTLQQLSGVGAIDAYMQTIIELTSSDISPEFSSIIFGFVQLPAVLAASFLVDKIGRRPLLIISALGCAIALFGEGAYFYLQNIKQVDVSFLAWLPTTAIALYLIMHALGIATLTYVLLGELFPTNIKGIAVSSFTFYGASLAFLVSKFFMPLADLWDIYVVFWMFGAVCVLGAIFVYFCLPETKGKTFAEIQAMLSNRKCTEEKENC